MMDLKTPALTDSRGHETPPYFPTNKMSAALCWHASATRASWPSFETTYTKCLSISCMLYLSDIGENSSSQQHNLLFTENGLSKPYLLATNARMIIRAFVAISSDFSKLPICFGQVDFVISFNVMGSVSTAC